MSQQDPRPAAGAGQPATLKFSEMSVGGKLAHIGKVILFFVSFGFAYPTIWSDD